MSAEPDWVELADARSLPPVLLRLPYRAGETLAEFLCRCGRIEATELGSVPAGIHGRLGAPEAVLAAGDRVELYRPLLADPKAARRRRAARAPLRGGARRG